MFYSPHAVEIKKLDPISYEQIAHAFQRDDLIIFTDPRSFKEFLFSRDIDNASLLLMSSGNYGGLDFKELERLF